MSKIFRVSIKHSEHPDFERIDFFDDDALDRAQALLNKLAESTPLDQCYKTYFEIEWENGKKHGGRLDIKHSSISDSHLVVQNIRKFAESSLNSNSISEEDRKTLADYCKSLIDNLNQS